MDVVVSGGSDAFACVVVPMPCCLWFRRDVYSDCLYQISSCSSDGVIPMVMIPISCCGSDVFAVVVPMPCGSEGRR